MARIIWGEALMACGAIPTTVACILNVSCLRLLIVQVRLGLMCNIVLHKPNGLVRPADAVDPLI